ncbi:polyamine aminopropyltransferase [Haliangium ochraceum]|uniref:Polyamine aminopropyltransferase n=1 Tax=Haliangium ochraceum (strain DSM 14365 / JCM 11303 / SMP-2) TaxID=502025 RepID=D0LRG7_HALO1|nr:polyamine aminopropyltransferase [Haliangium ochraceum]ACY17195.1 spermidine synthase [Haliangium ochraceum DSM 14365]
MGLWYEERFGEASRHSLRVRSTLHQRRSGMQDIEVLDTVQYGRVLVLDGVFMTSQRDEHYYHEMLVHPALVTAPAIRRVLIIGGGDGGTAREVLRHPGVESVVMVEIDGQVVEVSKEYLPELGAWSDPRLELRIEDGIAYLAQAAAGSFDVILVDGPDPIGPAAGLVTPPFFANARRALAPAGVFAMQSESFFEMRDTFLAIQRALRQSFPRVTPYFGQVPLYGSGSWSWTYATGDGDPLAIDEARLAAIAPGCRCYSREVHRAAFVHTPELQQALAALPRRG